MASTQAYVVSCNDALDIYKEYLEAYLDGRTDWISIEECIMGEILNICNGWKIPGIKNVTELMEELSVPTTIRHIFLDKLDQYIHQIMRNVDTGGGFLTKLSPLSGYRLQLDIINYSK